MVTTVTTLRLQLNHTFPGAFALAVEGTAVLMPGQVLVVFGPSGCGKTTLLRCVAGLETPARGLVQWGATTWLDTSQGVHWPPWKRHMSYLFQDSALFPHLTVEENVRYGLRARGANPPAHLYDAMDLVPLLEKPISALSGGQKQRVALARALAPQPSLLLLDEPFSALDQPAREVLCHRLPPLLREAGAAAVVVTHDRREALQLAQDVWLLAQGQVQARGAPEVIFAHAGKGLSRAFGEQETVVAGWLRSAHNGLATVDIQGTLLLSSSHLEPGPVWVCVDAVDVALQASGEAPAVSMRNRIPARVAWLKPHGAQMHVGLDCGFELCAIITAAACQDLHLSQGVPVTALIKAGAVQLVPRLAAP